MNIEQMTLFEGIELETIEQKIDRLQKKIHNLKCGLFKRYDETKRAVEFLEIEVETLVKETITGNRKGY